MANFPNQAEKIVLDYRQLECLASPIRNEIFWAFTSDAPRSVSEVAEEIGKSPQTVHYHLHELLEAGLLLGVEDRKRHARTETLYVWSGADMFQHGPTAPREYRDQSIKSFAAVARSMTREVEELHNAIDVDPQIFDAATFRHRTVRMSWEAAREFKRLVQNFIETFEESDESETEETLRVHIVAFACPTRGAAKDFAKKRKGKK